MLCGFGCCVFTLGAVPRGGMGCCRSRSTALDAVEDYDKYLEQSEAHDPAHDAGYNTKEGATRSISHSQTELQPMRLEEAVPSRLAHKPLSGSSQFEIQPPPARSPYSSRGNALSSM